MEIVDLTSEHPHYRNGMNLLESFGLLTSDIKGRDVQLWALADGETLAGVVGLERSGSIGLLRSLAISHKHRGQGLAKQLCDHVCAQAGELDGLYLLTETAAGFFAKIGFIEINRNDTPNALRETPQFSSLCPGSAIVMVKR